MVALARSAEETCAVLLKFREQRLVDKLDFDLGDMGELPAARAEFLLSYYNGTAEIPRLISLDGNCEDSALIARFLAERSGHSVHIIAPARGEKLRLVNMAAANAAQRLAQKTERTGRAGRDATGHDSCRPHRGSGGRA